MQGYDAKKETQVNINLNISPSQVDGCYERIKTQHPLLEALQPDLWKNIPLCLIDAVKILMAERLDAAEHLFDYQVKNNECVGKLFRMH